MKIYHQNTPVTVRILAPVLIVSDVPAQAQELVLIVDDPDAPMWTWVHWLVYNLPANTIKIDADNLPAEAKQGITDFGRIGWGGPCPPSGHIDIFKLYALNKKLYFACMELQNLNWKRS